MKAKVKKTGEIIDVSRTENIITSRGVEKQYFDNKREWCTYVKSELEFINEEPQRNTDWEQRRYEIANNCIIGILENDEMVYLTKEAGLKKNCRDFPKNVAEMAVAFADSLIAELKKGGEK